MSSPSLPLFDFFVDLPHPGASSSSALASIEIVISPSEDSKRISNELFPNIENISSCESYQKISRFAFPGYVDNTPQSSQPSSPLTTPLELTRYHIYQSSHQNHSHQFILPSNGLIAFVRTYIPNHVEGKSRMDIGRRCQRALILFTRLGFDSSNNTQSTTATTNNKHFFNGVLKTIESLIIQKQATTENVLSSSPENTDKECVSPKLFLYTLHSRYLSLQQQQTQTQQQIQQQQQKSPYMSVQGLEFGNVPNMFALDRYHFTPPSSTASTISAPILPLLRSLGPTTLIRLLTALLCEKRIVLLSHSATKLSACIDSCVSLIQPMQWKCLIVHILPSHLITHILLNPNNIKMPFLVGILKESASALRIDHYQNAIQQQVVCFDLDYSLLMNNNGTNNNMPPSASLNKNNNNTSGLPSAPVRLLGAPNVTRELDQVVPNILRGNLMVDDDVNNYAQVQYQSLGELLLQDLKEAEQSDKFKYTSNFQAAVQNVGNKLKDVGSFLGNKFRNAKQAATNSSNSSSRRSKSPIKSLSSRHIGSAISSSDNTNVSSLEIDLSIENTDRSSMDSSNHSIRATVANTATASAAKKDSVLMMDDTEILMENDLCEDDIRAGLDMFYLCLFGNPSWFLSNASNNSQQQALVYDKNKFMEERRKRGEGQGSAIYGLLYHMKETQLFHNFAQKRIHLLTTKTFQNNDSFNSTLNYITQNRIPFYPMDIRRVTKQLVTQRPYRQLLMKKEEIRNIVFQLTNSNKYEGDFNNTVSRITMECRLINSKLPLVMDILWLRVRACTTTSRQNKQSSQWKQCVHAFVILKNLILHGPITVLSDCMANIDKIRNIRNQYFFGNRQNSALLRRHAALIYSLLMDRTKLIIQRRAFANKRKEQQNGADNSISKKLIKENRLQIGNSKVPFLKMHIFLRPKIYPAKEYHTRSRAVNAPPSNPTTDLIGFHQQQPHYASTASSAAVSTSYNTADILSLGGSTAASTATAATTATSSNPFDMFDVSKAASDISVASTSNTNQPPQLSQQQVQAQRSMVTGSTNANQWYNNATPNQQQTSQYPSNTTLPAPTALNVPAPSQQNVHHQPQTMQQQPKLQPQPYGYTGQAYPGRYPYNYQATESQPQQRPALSHTQPTGSQRNLQVQQQAQGYNPYYHQQQQHGSGVPQNYRSTHQQQQTQYYQQTHPHTQQVQPQPPQQQQQQQNSFSQFDPFQKK